MEAMELILISAGIKILSKLSWLLGASIANACPTHTNVKQLPVKTRDNEA